MSWAFDLQMLSVVFWYMMIQHLQGRATSLKMLGQHLLYVEKLLFYSLCFIYSRSTEMTSMANAILLPYSY